MDGWMDGWMGLYYVCVLSWLCTMNGFSIGGLNKNIVIYCYLSSIGSYVIIKLPTNN